MKVNIQYNDWNDGTVYFGPCAPCSGFVRGIPRDPEESDSGVLSSSTSITGYTGGGTQVEEAERRHSSNSRAVGRAEASSLQHDRIKSQSTWERPRDSASRGFLGRSPFSIAGTGV